MGENLLEDLARALAEPVPRSRALRLLGSVLVATSLPGTAFARGRRVGRRTGQICHVEDGFGGQPCCSDEVCCGKKRCCPEYCAEDGSCTGCKPPLVRCGPEKCCPPGSSCCFRAAKRSAGWPLRARYVCCRPPNECSDRICSCPSGTTFCGRVCCKKGEHCSACATSQYDGETQYAGKLKCCPKGQDCCGSKCISKKLTCCDGKPCPESKPFCSDDDQCCSEEQFALLDDGTGVCCPDGTVATPEGDCARP